MLFCRPWQSSQSLFWDLETIPDLAAAARMLDLRNAER